MGTAASPVERGEKIERILDNLRRVVQVLYGHSRSVERASRVTSAQAWLITTLSGEGPCRISDLAHAMHLDPSVVVRIVGRLEGVGLLVRTVSSHGHGIARIALTHVGRMLSSRIPPIPQERILMGLSKAPLYQLRIVSEGLDSLARILGTSRVPPAFFSTPSQTCRQAAAPTEVGWRANFRRVIRHSKSGGRHEHGRRTVGKGKDRDPENIRS